MSDPPREPHVGAAALPAMRASDAERERAVDLLRHASTEGRLTVEELEHRLSAAYGAATRNELELLVADVTLEPIDGSPGAAIAPGAGGVTALEGQGGSRWLVSIMGGHERKGHWRVAPRLTVLNVMGGSDLDLTDAELSSATTELRVYSVMGGAEIHVPPGMQVHVSEFAFMGGNDVQLGEEPPAGSGPALHIRMVSVMGGCSVRRGPKLTRAGRRAERELRRAGRSDLERPADIERE